MILTSKHSTKLANTNKKHVLNEFIAEYRRVSSIILNDIWLNGYKDFNIKELRLEKIINIGYKNNTTRLLSHWTNTIIRDKVEKKSILNGVHFVEQSCTYRSQRCYCCGMVYKSNRKGKLYECKGCGYINDSDINAALNHSIDLPDISWNLYKSKINRHGFYWSVTGFYHLDGASIESALNKNSSCS